METLPPPGRKMSIDVASPRYAAIITPELFANSCGSENWDVEALRGDGYSRLSASGGHEDEDEHFDLEAVNAQWTVRKELRRLVALSGYAARTSICAQIVRGASGSKVQLLCSSIVAT
jgi:hypothetical protein